MASSKFRKGTDESSRAPAQPQSIEAIRRRAKYRLAGATLLVLIGVIGLPMLFDRQPRPMAVDMPISIPDRNKVPALVIPSAPRAAPPVAMPPAPLPAPVPATAVEAPKKPIAPASPAQTIKPAPAPVEKNNGSKPPSTQGNKEPVATNTIKKEALTASKPEPAKPETNRAQALLDGKAPDVKAPKAAAAVMKPAATELPGVEGRFVVQVGAFADSARAYEVRMKLERAGLKTYEQAAQTKDGRRTRVRLGPFATRADAEKAADKVKKLSLAATVLTL